MPGWNIQWQSEYCWLGVIYDLCKSPERPIARHHEIRQKTNVERQRIEHVRKTRSDVQKSLAFHSAPGAFFLKNIFIFSTDVCIYYCSVMIAFHILYMYSTIQFFQNWICFFKSSESSCNWAEICIPFGSQRKTLIAFHRWSALLILGNCSEFLYFCIIGGFHSKSIFLCRIDGMKS